MTAALATFACVLGLVTGQEVPDRCWAPQYEEVAGAVIAATERHRHVRPEHAVADIFHESGFRVHAIGARGEVGLMQVKRGGAVPPELARLPNHVLARPYLNVELGVAYMEQFAARCPDPNRYLTRYNRPVSGCHSGKYSRGVMRDLRRGQAALRRIQLGRR